MKERDQWEEAIRSKLRDFEVDTKPEDWKAIADRLPGKKVMFSRRWYYVAAAIALFLFVSIGYYYVNFSHNVPVVADIPDKITEHLPDNTPESDFFAETDIPENSMPVDASPQPLQVSQIEETTEPAKLLFDLTPLAVLQKPQIEVKSNYSLSERLLSLRQTLKDIGTTPKKEEFLYMADATPVTAEKKSARRWSIGAGGGSYSVSSNGGGFINDVRLHSASYELVNPELSLVAPVKRDDYLNEILANSSNSIAPYNVTSIQKTGLSHKQPISFGIGIGYALDDRWSLQSGLVYTLLSSEWSTNLNYQGKIKQRLHFVGVPLGISYKIAEWNKLRFYATTGGMAEWNIAGNIKTGSYSMEKEAWQPEKEAVRMKETQWSVNARVGATYPVIKFVNAYVEGGANYYFDNKSSIETIRSSKPFHVSLQAGLRLGF